MSIHEFRDDDQGYLEWLARHNDGYVVNINRSFSATDARLHQADCSELTRDPGEGKARTGSYIKICSTSASELDQWAAQRVPEAIRRCGTCQPSV
jgi:hypothetical protein